MKVLLIEDETQKLEAISGFLRTKLTDRLDLTIARDLAEARRKIIADLYDLIIFDIFLPVSKSSPEKIDVSNDLLEEYSTNKNFQTEALAITAYAMNDLVNIKAFNAYGVSIVEYSEDRADWQASLSSKILKAKANSKVDFLIFCALTKERDAYSETKAELGDLRAIRGMDCREIQISGLSGLCITPHNKGLVNMAVLASKAIEHFSPSLVAMSGICAGVAGHSNYLDIIVAERCWEYQTGKFVGNEFRQEPYQVAIKSSLLTEINQFVANKELLPQLKQGLYDSELKHSSVIIGPVSSGSTVIASTARIAEIAAQHRAMLGLEMEMYSMYEAATQSLVQPLYFGAKAVVDFADLSKRDDFHASACILSARFVVDFITAKKPSLFS